jgi:hypothetical protein
MTRYWYIAVAPLCEGLALDKTLTMCKQALIDNQLLSTKQTGVSYLLKVSPL